jgi:hypothetical protein
MTLGPFPLVERLTRPAPRAEQGTATTGNGASRPTRGGGRGGGQQGIAGALRGRVTMSDFRLSSPCDVLAKVPQLDVRELEWTSYAGTPLFNANLSLGKSQLLSMDGTPVQGFNTNRIADLIIGAVPNPSKLDITVIDQYDFYYLDRTRRRPLPVMRVLMNDEENTRYYIDPKSARIVSTYSNRNWGESLARLRTSLPELSLPL